MLTAQDYAAMALKSCNRKASVDEAVDKIMKGIAALVEKESLDCKFECIFTLGNDMDDSEPVQATVLKKLKQLGFKVKRDIVFMSPCYDISWVKHAAKI